MSLWHVLCEVPIMGFINIFLFLAHLFGAVLWGGSERARLVTVPSETDILATKDAFEGRLETRGFTILLRQVQTPLEENQGKVLYVFGKPDRVDEEGWMVVDSPHTVVVWATDTGEAMLSYERKSLPGEHGNVLGAASRAETLQSLVENIGESVHSSISKHGPPASPTGLSVVSAN